MVYDDTSCECDGYEDYNDDQNYNDGDDDVKNEDYDGCEEDDQNYNDDSDDDYDVWEEDTSECREQQSCTILSYEDIRQRLEADITRISAVLSIPRAEASILLCHYNWNSSKLEEEWFGDEDEIRRACGLMYDQASVAIKAARKSGKITCTICYEGKKAFTSLACGHPFCIECWSQYVKISIDDGPGCLKLTCPEPSCRRVVDTDTVNFLVPDEYREKYARQLVRFYVQVNKKIKWCPGPGCELAVGFEFGSESSDVLCACSHGFCWKCEEEAHRPVNCETVEKWNIKNSSEAENVTWILANSKACPKCKVPIEKNNGCMHMTCIPPCLYEFCWLCLGDWRGHEDYNGCNAYVTAKREGVHDEEENRRQMAKSVLEKYTHYYERFSGNESSRKRAIADLNRCQTEQLEKLSDIQKATVGQLKFLTDAWLQIIEGRRVLKWTYAYGYYMPGKKRAKRSLFEDLQGQAESALERLHHCVEEELTPFLKEESSSFHEFKLRVTGLTAAAKDFFENLVTGIENDLAEVQCDKKTSSEVGKGRKTERKRKKTAHNL